MHRLNRDRTLRRGRGKPIAAVSARKHTAGFCLVLLMACLAMLSACSSSSSSSGSQQNGSMAGNWQFSMTNADPNYPAGFLYGLQGGFLLQTNGTVNGQASYYIYADQAQGGLFLPCDSGSANITGTISGQSVTLTAVAGTQTFSLTGTLTSNGSISGTFTTPGGQVTSGGQNQVCGAATPQGGTETWTATSVAAISGSVNGTFHSSGLGLNNQDFQVTGNLNQGPNIGASSATVTGQLSFANPTTLLSMYPCFPSGYVNVNGQISGNTVILQLIGTDGSTDGQIGIAPSSVQSSGGFTQVTFDPVMPSGYVLHSSGLGYQVNTKSCGSSVGEVGYVCLALNNTTACQQPIILSPPFLTFSPQMLMCTAQDCPSSGQGTTTTQTITLTNNQAPGAAPLTNLTIGFNPDLGVDQSDFTGLPNFSESDNCASFLSSSTSGQSCTITITFTPQEGCSWPPDVAGGVTVAGCPLPLNASLTVTSPVTNDNDTSFAVPITGAGLSYVQPSVKEIDFGAEAVGEASEPQLLSLTNQSAYPVQIVGPRTSPCRYSNIPFPLPLPIINNGAVAGLQVVISPAYSSGPPAVVRYTCDADQVTEAPDFQISSDTCTGANLLPGATCSVEISFIAQPEYPTFGAGLDYFLQLNTLQCSPSGAASDCEIDSGRFPVEIKANGFSPLRMTPAAGLDFGVVPSGKTTAAQTVTLFNDPSDPHSATVTFSGKFVVSGNYTETDDCPISFAPGSACTITVTSKPSTGFNQGSVKIIYTLGSNTLGNPQFVYLRGTGQ